MTKTYKFNNKKSNSNTFFLGNNKSADYSSILDDIITADIIKKNSYLFNTGDNYDTLIDSLIDDSPIILTGSKLKANDDFTKAANFLANYKKNKNSFKIHFTFGKMYTLSNGTPIVFYDDEIQIGFDTYKYSDFADLSFLNNLTTSTKNIIINIYTTSAANIKINIL